MQKIQCRFTVFFQNPFWVGVYERIQDGRLEVCKITFGAEPRDYQVYAYLLEHWHRLRFSPAVEIEPETPGPKNPKRLQRELTHLLSPTGVGTKSQQALKLQQEQAKHTRQIAGKARRLEEQRRRFALKQEKKRQKKKGH